MVKIQSNSDNAIFISNNDGEFAMFYEEVDLCWRPIYSKNSDYKYTITNEDDKLYEFMSVLYERLIDINSTMISDNEINWHSDNDAYDEGSILNIKREQDMFIIRFYESKRKSQNNTFDVKFHYRNSRRQYIVNQFSDLFYDLKRYVENEKSYQRKR